MAEARAERAHGEDHQHREGPPPPPAAVVGLASGAALLLGLGCYLMGKRHGRKSVAMQTASKLMPAPLPPAQALPPAKLVADAWAKGDGSVLVLEGKAVGKLTPAERTPVEALKGEFAKGVETMPA